MSSSAAAAPLLAGAAVAHVQKAALHVQDAWNGTERIHPREGRAERRLWLVHLALHWPVRLSLLALVLLAFFEAPAWTVEVGPAAFNSTLYPVSGLPLLSPLVAAGSELLLLAVILLDAICSAAAQGTAIMLRARIKLVYLIVVALAVVEAVGSAAGLWRANVSRVAPFLRLLLLVLQSSSLLSQLDLIRRTLPQVAGIFFVLILFVVGFAEAAMILFGGVGAPGGGFGEATWRLFICLTTANFPDVMMREYTESRAVVLFFAAFMLVGHAFLLNLVLAVVVKAHSDSAMASANARVDFTRAALRSAFAELLESVAATDHGLEQDAPPRPVSLPPETVLAMFKELNLYREIAHIGDTRAQLLFAALDRSGDSFVDEAEFLQLSELLRIRFDRVPRRTWVEVLAPAFSASAGWRRMCALVRSRRLDYAVDVLLLLAGGLLIAEEEQAIGDGGRPTDFDSRPDSPWNILELTLSVLFIIEMLLKIAANGTHAYFRSLKNTFDAASSVATFAVVLVVYFPNAISDARFIRLVLLLRLLRLLRLLHWSPQVRFVASTFVAVLPDANRLLKLLFVLLYFFSALGMAIFGGAINLDPARSEAQILAKTDYFAADYLANNFNDLASGVVTCFELLLVNNWFVLCEGFVAVSSPWARLFFVAVYLCGPLLLLNVAVAAVMEAFLLFSDAGAPPLKYEVADPQDAGLASRRADDDVATEGGGGSRVVAADDFSSHLEPSGAAALIDASMLSGTRTGLSGVYRASTRPRESKLMYLERSTQSPSQGAS